MSSQLADVDVVIVNYNAGTALLQSVASGFVAGAAGVIVVDNQSTDGSLEPLERAGWGEKLRVVRNGRNLGFAAACNIGARLSTARRLLFLNPDSVLAPDALTRMARVLDSSEAIGMVGGLLCNPDGSEQRGGRRRFPTPRRALLRAFGLTALARRLPDADFTLHEQPLPSGPGPVEAISGACMLVRREAMEDVGPWDEGYFLHCEDLDWCMRFHQRGWQVMFVPEARITHLQGTSSRGRPVFVEWHKHRGMLRFYRKFFRQQYSALLWPLVVLSVWLRFLSVAGYLTMRRLLPRAGERRG